MKMPTIRLIIVSKTKDHYLQWYLNVFQWKQITGSNIIFQELIQNAEDAGATQVKFLIDHHSYGNNPQKLQHPGLAKFQVV